MALDSLLDAAQLDWKETEPCARQVTIKFPQEAVAGAFDQASRETAKQAQVPGFRKGKAPLSLIKAKYKDYIADDVTRLLHQAAFSKVTSDKSADIFSACNRTRENMDICDCSVIIGISNQCTDVATCTCHINV